LKPGAPRNISSRNHAFKLMTAPITLAGAEQLYKKDWYIMKVPQFDRGNWLYEKLKDFPTLIELDFSKYDAH